MGMVRLPGGRTISRDSYEKERKANRSNRTTPPSTGGGGDSKTGSISYGGDRDRNSFFVDRKSQPTTPKDPAEYPTAPGGARAGQTLTPVGGPALKKYSEPDALTPQQEGDQAHAQGLNKIFERNARAQGREYNPAKTSFKSESWGGRSIVVSGHKTGGGEEIEPGSVLPNERDYVNAVFDQDTGFEHEGEYYYGPAGAQKLYDLEQQGLVDVGVSGGAVQVVDNRPPIPREYEENEHEKQFKDKEKRAKFDNPPPGFVNGFNFDIDLRPVGTEEQPVIERNVTPPDIIPPNNVMEMGILGPETVVKVGKTAFNMPGYVAENLDKHVYSRVDKISSKYLGPGLIEYKPVRDVVNKIGETPLFFTGGKLKNASKEQLKVEGTLTGGAVMVGAKGLAGKTALGKVTATGRYLASFPITTIGQQATSKALDVVGIRNKKGLDLNDVISVGVGMYAGGKFYSGTGKYERKIANKLMGKGYGKPELINVNYQLGNVGPGFKQVKVAGKNVYYKDLISNKKLGSFTGDLIEFSDDAGKGFGNIEYTQTSKNFLGKSKQTKGIIEYGFKGKVKDIKPIQTNPLTSLRGPSKGPGKSLNNIKPGNLDVDVLPWGEKIRPPGARGGYLKQWKNYGQYEGRSLSTRQLFERQKARSVISYRNTLKQNYKKNNIIDVVKNKDNRKLLDKGDIVADQYAVYKTKPGRFKDLVQGLTKSKTRELEKKIIKPKFGVQLEPSKITTSKSGSLEYIRQKFVYDRTPFKKGLGIIKARIYPKKYFKPKEVITQSVETKSYMDGIARRTTKTQYTIKPGATTTHDYTQFSFNKIKQMGKPQLTTKKTGGLMKGIKPGSTTPGNFPKGGGVKFSRPITEKPPANNPLFTIKKNPKPTGGSTPNTFKGDTGFMMGLSKQASKQTAKQLPRTNPGIVRGEAVFSHSLSKQALRQDNAFTTIAPSFSRDFNTPGLLTENEPGLILRGGDSHLLSKPITITTPDKLVREKPIQPTLPNTPNKPGYVVIPKGGLILKPKQDTKKKPITTPSFISKTGQDQKQKPIVIPDKVIKPEPIIGHPPYNPGISPPPITTTPLVPPIPIMGGGGGSGGDFGRNYRSRRWRVNNPIKTVPQIKGMGKLEVPSKTVKKSKKKKKKSRKRRGKK